MRRKKNAPVNKANKIPKLIHFSEELLVELKNTSDKLGISSVWIVNMAVREYLDRLKAKGT